MLHHVLYLCSLLCSFLPLCTRAREKKQKNAKISEKQKKNAFLFVNNNKYHHELLLFAEKRRSSCDDTENINNEY